MTQSGFPGHWFCNPLQPGGVLFRGGQTAREFNKNQEGTAMKLGDKFQRIAAVGIMSLSLAAPVVLAQTGNTQQGDTGKTEPGFRRDGRRGGHGRRGFGGRMFGFLNLTDAQKEQVKQIRESHKASLVAIRQQIQAKHRELRQSEAGGTFNESLAAQKLAEIAPLQARMMAEEFQIRQQTLAILTPEQKAKLDQAREQFKNRRNQWKNRRSEGGAPKV
jgi:protein CpxP